MRPVYNFEWYAKTDVLGVEVETKIDFKYVYRAKIPACADGAEEPEHVEIVEAIKTNHYKETMDAMPDLNFIYLDDEIAEIEAEILKHHE